MNNLYFSSASNPAFDDVIEKQLVSHLSLVTGHPQTVKHSIYAECNNITIGGIITYQHGDILWIDAILIAESQQRKGIGKLLIQHIIAYGQQQNIREIQLNTYFKDAHIFFTKLGFETVVSVPYWKYGLACHLMRIIL